MLGKKNNDRATMFLFFFNRQDLNGDILPMLGLIMEGSI